MGTIIAVPTLSLSGWTTGIVDKCDFAFAHFWESDKKQTALYGDNVTNLHWILEQNVNRPENLTSSLRDELDRYLSRYFTSVDVVVSSDLLTNVTNSLNIEIYISVIDDGKTYSFGNLIGLKDGKFDRAVRLNNYGV